MIKQWIIAVGLAGGLCLWFSGTAVAHGPLYQHHHPASPFETLKSKETPHCPLHLLAEICPHSHVQEADINVIQIGSDCGGNPAGGIPASLSFDKNPNLTEFSVPLQSAVESHPLVSPVSPLATVLPDPPEQPPKFL